MIYGDCMTSTQHYRQATSLQYSALPACNVTPVLSTTGVQHHWLIRWNVLQMHQELEKIRRRLETELAEAREQLAEKTAQLVELQALVNKREEELQHTLNR